jgi:hypothetical protein
MTSRSFSKLQEKSKNNLSYKHTFDVSITSPESEGFVGPGSISTYNGDFHVLSCTTPGRQVGTEQKTIWGPVYNVPTERVYSGDFEMTCLYSQPLHQYITNWMNTIKNAPDDKVNYYNDIIGGLVITYYSGDRWKKMSRTIYNLYDCFPVTMNGIELNAASQNEYQTMSISWSFRQFELQVGSRGEAMTDAASGLPQSRI